MIRVWIANWRVCWVAVALVFPCFSMFLIQRCTCLRGISNGQRGIWAMRVFLIFVPLDANNSRIQTHLILLYTTTGWKQVQRCTSSCSKKKDFISKCILIPFYEMGKNNDGSFYFVNGLEVFLLYIYCTWQLSCVDENYDLSKNEICAKKYKNILSLYCKIHKTA